MKKFDKSKFDSKTFIKRVEKPWGWEIHFTPDNLPYMGKILHINTGKRISLQIHDQKTESWYLLWGKIKMVVEGAEIEMEKGVGYTIPVNTKHRLVGIEEGEVLEVSTPEIGNTIRLEDDYARPTETESMRKSPNRGWSGV